MYNLLMKVLSIVVLLLKINFIYGPLNAYSQSSSPQHLTFSYSQEDWDNEYKKKN
jgi:hypothetical protein